MKSELGLCSKGRAVDLLPNLPLVGYDVISGRRVVMTTRAEMSGPKTYANREAGHTNTSGGAELEVVRGCQPSVGMGIGTVTTKNRQWSNSRKLAS